MAALNTQANFHQPGRPAGPAYGPGDDFYEALMLSHRGLDAASSRLLNARLILLLANHIGNLDTLAEALKAARAGLEPAPDLPA